MIEIHSINCDAYYNPEVRRYLATSHCLNLTVSGMDYWRTSEQEAPNTDPHLSMTTDGTKIDMGMNRDRENWVILFHSDAIRRSNRRGYFELFNGDDWLSLPGFVSLRPDEVAELKAAFRKVRNLLRSPSPANLFLTKLEIAGIFRFLSDTNERLISQSPVAKFKELIDKDNRFAFTLAELSDRCGYSSDHMRLLFEQEFGISPNDYRTKFRMTLVHNLIAGSELSVKEIAAECGFRNASHLSGMYKKHTGLTPRNGIQKYRHFM